MRFNEAKVPTCMKSQEGRLERSGVMKGDGEDEKRNYETVKTSDNDEGKVKIYMYIEEG
jgi:hypothetical protein